jgi:DNA-binding GntR family transcriptional regulator
MARTSTTFNHCYNLALDLISNKDAGADLPTETCLAEQWNVSRTTIRGILTGLRDAGIISWQGRSKTVLRKPRKDEYFPKYETASDAERLPSLFMEYIFAGELAPGEALIESDLAKHFGVSSTVMREFLIRFSRFGLIEKQPNKHWILVGFTREFAEELFCVRAIFEREAFDHFLQSGEYQEVIALEGEHIRLLKTMPRDYLQFPRLDEKLHRVWIDGFGNRFVRDFFELISLIFHYHYRWNKSDEMERNQAAAEQHLAIIQGLKSGDAAAAERAFSTHLSHARETLFASASWDAGG